jgi:hypothetical protein
MSLSGAISVLIPRLRINVDIEETKAQLLTSLETKIQDDRHGIGVGGFSLPFPFLALLCLFLPLGEAFASLV